MVERIIEKEPKVIEKIVEKEKEIIKEKTHEVKTHEVKTHEVKTHEVKVIEKQQSVGLSAEEIEKITKDMKEKQIKMEELSKIQLVKFEENIKIMKKELEDYKQQNKVKYSDLERNLNDKCALSQLEEVHNTLLNELKRHELNTYSKLQDIDLEGNKKHNDTYPSPSKAVSSELLDQIMKKMDEIKSSKF